MADHLERRTKPRDTDRLNAARERLDVVLADARRLRAAVQRANRWVVGWSDVEPISSAQWPKPA